MNLQRIILDRLPPVSLSVFITRASTSLSQPISFYRGVRSSGTYLFPFSLLLLADFKLRANSVNIVTAIKVCRRGWL